MERPIIKEIIWLMARNAKNMAVRITSNLFAEMVIQKHRSVNPIDTDLKSPIKGKDFMT